MASLDRWFARESRREARRTSADDAVVFGRFDLYVAERSTRFVVTRLAQETLYVAELYLLFMFATDTVFMTAALVVFGARTATSAWWGGLEVLRTGIRARARDGRMGSVGPWILRWTQSMGVIGAGLAMGVITVDAVSLATTGIDFAAAYVTVWLIGFAVELPVRAFHAGAYALRRVYQPTWSLLGPSVLRTALLIACWPGLGIWSIVPASASSMLATAALTAYFTRRTYEELELWPLADSRARRAPRLLPLRGDRWKFVATSAAGACLAIGHLSGLTLLFLSVGDPDLWLGVFVYLVLASPLTDACLAWTRLFYPDLARLEGPLLERFRGVLERLLLRWSPIVGVVLWLPTLLVVSILPGDRRLEVAVVTLVLFVVRARLAAVQFVAFANGRYGFVLAVSAAAAIAGSSGYVIGRMDTTLWVLAAVLIALWFLRPPAARYAWSGVLPLAAMIAAARRIRGTGTWTLSEFAPGRLLHGPGTLLKSSARRFGSIGVEQERFLLRWQPRGKENRAASDPLEDAQGRRWQSEADSACGALAGWAREWPAGALPRACSLAEVMREFRDRFPDGTCVEPGRAVDHRVRARLSWRERRHVLEEAVQFAFGGKPTAILPVDVSAIVDDGRLAALFLIPRTAEPSARRGWRRWLRRVAIANALAAIERHANDTASVRANATRTPEPSPRRFWGLRPVR